MDNSNQGQGRTPFGERLLAARRRKGLSQKQVEARVGISQSNLGALETKGTGSAFTVALALLYGVRPEWLAMGKGPMEGAAPIPDWLSDLTERELEAVRHFAAGLVAARQIHGYKSRTRGMEPPTLPSPDAPIDQAD
ncbi:helix-turn-helix transcriptional regulator [Burkholderia cepacia]|jgi:transcriptional regulator with XRE-family HTH domain|uniref:Helix-turn-helix domain-containing protein n=1 Tax=Burkholderia contaminans TaxID=488447 RepID=A0ABD7YHE8_9BURK|nr:MULTISPECIES: helix-turn-helix transcriptional regulator [Burkholderia]EKS9799004.1 helix-turn-helix transcriptional regulator [Burkholderia cepacia]EKS9805958.1 helix-turn-helix transcriptional regulator [Burkholderia cepacia]EKS9813506.1 helix-turn-helix transcriptional regulator [Burkholderia cepacia]EKS9820345.1 helix-turn-helix transcriptional regulator [Burkholderia cepacia]EKS9828210.1 helix-turn-helix transcriptional regulator [Burkholderia cepacia]